MIVSYNTGFLLAHRKIDSPIKLKFGTINGIAKVNLSTDFGGNPTEL